MWNKPHRDVANEKAEVVFKADEILGLFQTNYDSTWNTFGNKTIAVEGSIGQIVSDSNATYITFNVSKEGGVVCYFENAEQVTNKNSGDAIKIKGIITGYDADLFQEVEITKALVTE